MSKKDDEGHWDKVKIKPCPCCGEPGRLMGNALAVMVLCTHCGLRTPTFDSSRSAAQVWNKRAGNKEA